MPTSWRALEDAIDGEVVLPGAPQYETLRRPAIARFDDARPQAIVLCATPSDVAETISVARDLGVRAAPRSGGHCFAGRSSTEGIVIDVTPMRSVSVADGLVSVGAGARLEHVYDALDDRGLTIAAGCGPSVGIAGLTLGGGLGILARKHGLTADQLPEAEVVLADGRIVACDEHRDEELFWALRGAGGATSASRRPWSSGRSRCPPRRASISFGRTRTRPPSSRRGRAGRPRGRTSSPRAC